MTNFEVNVNSPRFTTTLNKDGEYHVYLKVLNRQSRPTSFVLLSDQVFIEESSFLSWLEGGIIGILVGLFCINFYLALSLRSRAHFAYCAFIFVSILTTATGTIDIMGEEKGVTIIMLGGMLRLNFMTEFLQTSKYAPLIHK